MGDDDNDEKGRVQGYILCLMSLIHRGGSASTDGSLRHRARVHLLRPDEEAEGHDELNGGEQYQGIGGLLILLMVQVSSSPVL